MIKTIKMDVIVSSSPQTHYVTYQNILYGLLKQKNPMGVKAQLHILSWVGGKTCNSSCRQKYAC